MEVNNLKLQEMQELEAKVKEMQEKNSDITYQVTAKDETLILQDEDNSLRDIIKRIFTVLQNSSLKSRKRSLAITKLQEAYVWLDGRQ